MYPLLDPQLLYKVTVYLLLRLLQLLLIDHWRDVYRCLQLRLQVSDLTLQLRDDLRVLRDVVLHVQHVPLHVCLDVLRTIRIF